MAVLFAFFLGLGFGFFCLAFDFAKALERVWFLGGMLS
jgi:hypothetical protein